MDELLKTSSVALEVNISLYSLYHMVIYIYIFINFIIDVIYFYYF